ncbi:heme biosynthesis HemY N-terminal domain-containing protein [Thalassotalea crassostreae]|uniref:heme biosynthesis HemY N-terminal domain-containing protein n=1 Tax=Thalassotalea crassostreae TaxID=1763536 RepID=UPI00083819A1|nr:heme biosynthesis HemY N-terminal domain-containing protein [Thalassotalea crassostreae]
MIRNIIKFVLVIALIALAPMLIDEKGYILIAMGDLTYELTVVSALVLLTLLAFVLMFLFWGTRIGFKFGSTTIKRFAFGNKTKAKRSFQQGIGAYLVGDYKHSQDLMSKCAEQSEMANSAWLVAAKSADELADTAQAQNFLQLINEHPKAQENFSFETLLVAGRIYLKQQQFAKLRALLDSNHRFINHDWRLLGLEVELLVSEQSYDKAFDNLKAIRKDKQHQAEQLSAWEHLAFTAYYQQLITAESVESVAKHYKGLGRKERQSEGITLAYAKVLANNGLQNQLEDLVLPLVKKGASASFINKIKTLPYVKSQHIIQVVQKLLQKDQENTLWLSALAHLCAGNNELEKAQKAFVSLLKLEQNKEDLEVYANVLVLMNEDQQAIRVYQEIMANH